MQYMLKYVLSHAVNQLILILRLIYQVGTGALAEKIITIRYSWCWIPEACTEKTVVLMIYVPGGTENNLLLMFQPTCVENL